MLQVRNKDIRFILVITIANMAKEITLLLEMVVTTTEDL